MLDDLDKCIVAALAVNARLSLKELAGHVGLSSPSTSERLRRLRDNGVIGAFTVEIAPAAMGYNLQAIVHIKPLPGKLQVVEKLIKEIGEVVECDKVTGDDCFICRLYAPSMEQIDAILHRISEKAETKTSIVKSQPVKRRLPAFI
jgi:Lrp/AsnC family leucine-responsive transcriptional regulator